MNLTIKEKNGNITGRYKGSIDELVGAFFVVMAQDEVFRTVILTAAETYQAKPTEINKLVKENYSKKRTIKKIK